MISDAPLHIRQSLKILGFSENEVRVISVLFSAGKLTVKQISRLSAIPLDSVRYILNLLEKKELLTIEKEGKSDYITICSQQEFLDWIDAQKEQNIAIYEGSKQTLQTHFNNFDTDGNHPTVTYFEGVEGVREIYEDMIASGDDIYCWTDLDKIYNTLGQEYIDTFVKRRIAADITTHVIKPHGTIASDSSLDEERHREVKFVDELSLEGEIRVFGEKVAVISFSKEKPVGFLLQGPIIASMFKNLFENDWRKL